MFVLKFFLNNGVHVVQAPHYSVTPSELTGLKVVTVYPSLTTEYGVEYRVAGGRPVADTPESKHKEPESGLDATCCTISNEHGRVIDTVHFAFMYDGYGGKDAKNI